MNKRSDIQELFLQLYLRLNGYFTTGFIVHAPDWGRNHAQVDALAVRHPFSKEPERIVDPSPFLQLEDGLVDLLVCEVKSRHLQFNRRLREDPGAVATVLRWSGLFHESDIGGAAARLQRLMLPGCLPAEAAAGVRCNSVRVRALLCCPEIPQARPNQPWCLAGSELFSYAARCLNPLAPRATCSTQYDFTAWGPFLEPLVRYFKSRPPDNVGTIDDLYEELGMH